MVEKIYFEMGRTLEVSMEKVEPKEGTKKGEEGDEDKLENLLEALDMREHNFRDVNLDFFLNEAR